MKMNAMTTTPPLKFAGHLQRALDKHKITPSEVNSRVQINRDRVNEFLNGQGLPTGSEMQRLCSLMPELNTVRELLAKEKNSPPVTPSVPLSFHIELPAPAPKPEAEKPKVPAPKPEAEKPKTLAPRRSRETFGAALYRIYTAAGHTARDVAAVLGVSDSAVRAWVNDKVTPIEKHYTDLLVLLPELADVAMPSCRDIEKPVGNIVGHGKTATTSVDLDDELRINLDFDFTPDVEAEEKPVKPEPEPVKPTPIAAKPSIGAMMVRWSKLIQRDSYSKSEVKELLSIATTLGMTQAEIVESFPDDEGS